MFGCVISVCFTNTRIDTMNNKVSFDNTCIPKKRTGPINNKQKNLLIEFMAAHPELQSGKFTTEFTFKKAQTLWQNVTNELNAVSFGAVKDWRQWRKTWQDLKKNTKVKASKEKKYCSQTGGGEPIETSLDSNELKMLDMISTVSMNGLSNVEESEFSFDLDYDTAKKVIITEGPTSDDERPSSIAAVLNNLEKENSEPAVADHSYTLSHPPVGNSKLKQTPQKLSKTRRLENSLKISQELVRGVDTRNEIVAEYYKTKINYINHRINYESQKLKIMTNMQQIMEQWVEKREVSTTNF